MLSIKWWWLELLELSLQNVRLRPPCKISDSFLLLRCLIMHTLGMISDFERVCALLVECPSECWCLQTLLDFLDLLWSSLLSWDLNASTCLALVAFFVREYLLTYLYNIFVLCSSWVLIWLWSFWALISLSWSTLWLSTFFHKLLIISTSSTVSIPLLHPLESVSAFPILMCKPQISSAWL